MSPESSRAPDQNTPIFTIAAKQLIAACLCGVLAGLASAVLLIALDRATHLREAHPWMLSLLPLSGLVVGLIYHHFGRPVERGNHLILEEIHTPSATIPLRMAPLVLFGTVMTHLFGGSAGREGTALQMGASLADQIADPLRLSPAGRRILLMCGLSAGFGSVFGTPWAGAIFGIEVLRRRGKIHLAILPCVLASIIGDLTTRLCGVHHTVYRVTAVPSPDWRGFLCSIAAGAIFGIVAFAFARSMHTLSHIVRNLISSSPLRPVFGGVAIIALALAVHHDRYLGLGIPTIAASFTGQVRPYDFAGKFLFTVITLATGFKGGEVTPLFFIGATLGNALALLLPLPSALLAGMGFVAVFAGAAKTPFASTIMAIELFGWHAGVYAAIACLVSYMVSGEAGIYHLPLARPTPPLHLPLQS